MYLTAMAWCAAQSVIFVSSLYVLVPARVRNLDRSHPLHIRHRIIALCAATAFSGFGTWAFFADEVYLKELLWGGANWRTTIIPLAWYVALFLGPLSQLLLLPDSSELNLLSGFWIDLRNLVIAPITEELVFRTFMGATMLPYFPTSLIVYFVPLFFGFAHVHHAVLRVRRRECDVKSACLTALFQTMYTTFFGALMMQCLFATRNTLSIILIHSWCNIMGFPMVTALWDADKYPLSARAPTGIFYLIGIVLFAYFDTIVTSI